MPPSDLLLRPSSETPTSPSPTPIPATVSPTPWIMYV